MRLLIVGSFIVAFILSVLPVDPDLRWLRPEFVVLMIIYWSMYTPQHFGIFTAWCVGLLQDIIELSLLGPNALALSMVAYICQLSYQRIRNYTVWRQSGWVFVFVSIYLFFGNWTMGMLDKAVATYLLLLSAFISAFLWPLIVFFCDYLTGQSTWHESKD